MSAVRWFFGTKAKYEALKKANNLHPEGMYFLTDSNEYYYKDVQYMNNIIYFTGDLPDIDYITTDHVYFNTDTLTAYTYANNQWNVLVEPPSVSVLVDFNNLKSDGVPQMVSGQAAKVYIDKLINTNNEQGLVEISWDHVNKYIRFKRYVDINNNDPATLYVNQFAASIGVAVASGTVKGAHKHIISLYASDGVTVLSNIEILLDNYMVSGIYDNDEKAIIFTMSNGDDVKIYAQSIIKIYNRLNSSSVTTNLRTINGLNYIEMAVNISAAAGNEIFLASKTGGLAAYNPREGQTGSTARTITTDAEEGLYVNREHLIDFVAANNTGKVLKLDTIGNAALTTNKIGAATFNSNLTTRQTMQATEQGVTDQKNNTLTMFNNTYLKLADIDDQYTGFAAAFKVRQL